MRALLLDTSRCTASVHSGLPLPVPVPRELLIQVEAIALNPVDALYVFNPIGSTGRTVGSDFAGTVISAPSPSGPTDIRVGDRVAGFLQGASSGNDRPGAFAEYVICAADLLWRVPDGMSLEEAATVSLCGLTAAQSLFYRMGISAPFDWDDGEGSMLHSSASAGDKEADDGSGHDKEPIVVLIYGASTSVGMFAAQLLRRGVERAGRKLTLLGAASQARFPFLCTAPYSYDELVDYRDEDWPTRIRSLTGGVGVDFALDCISEGTTVRLVSRTLKSGTGKMAIVRSRAGGAWEDEGLAEGVEPLYGAVWEGLGEEVEYNGGKILASARARAFAAAFCRWLSEGGKIRLEGNPVRVMPGGLERVAPDGFALLGSGTMGDRKTDESRPWMKPVRGEKLVYRLGTSTST